MNQFFSIPITRQLLLGVQFDPAAQQAVLVGSELVHKTIPARSLADALEPSGLARLGFSTTPDRTPEVIPLGTPIDDQLTLRLRRAAGLP